MLYEFYQKEKRNYFRVCYTLFFLTVFFAASVQAQVTIGSNTPPKTGALLDLNQNYSSQSNTQVNSQKGLGLPRVSLTSLTSLAPMVETPTAEDSLAHIGLTVYNVTSDAGTGLTQGVYTWNGPQWVRILNSGDVANNTWLTTGNADTNRAENFLGTTDNQPLVFRVNNTRAGYISANYNSIGPGALANNTTGTGNNAMGNNALAANTSGNSNTAIGYSALAANTTGSSNVAIGYQAGSGTATGSNNIAIGSNTGFTTTGTSDQLNIGNAIFGTGINGTTATPAGNIGIRTVPFTNRVLHVNANSNPLRFQNLPAPPDASTALNSLVIDGNGDIYASQASSAGQIIRIELEETTGDAGTNPDYGGTSANGNERPVRIVNVENQTPSRAPNNSSNYINTIRGAHFRWNYGAGADNGAPARTTDQVILPPGVYKVTLRIVGSFNNSAQDNTLFIKAIVDGKEYSLSNNAANSRETVTFLYEDFIIITDREQSLDFTVDTKDGTQNTFQIVPGASPGNSTGVSIRSLLLIERLR